MSVMAHVVRRFTYPAERPIISLTLYYAVLITLLATLLTLVPELRPLVSGERLAQLSRDANSFTTSSAEGSGFWLSWQFALLLGFAMLGSLLLMIPTSWAYMASRRKKGFDQTVVQTMIILALSVAGVVVIVRNSLALAFSLAGIVGAVRFRNTLSDTRDTLYVFIAIGVGLAAGVEAIAAALILSMVFNYAIVLLQRLDYGMCELGRPAGHLRLTAAASNGAEPSSNRKAPKKKAPDFNAVLLVRTVAVDSSRQAVEGFLAQETKRWQLMEVESTGSERAVLKYLVRLGKRAERTEVEDALLAVGAPHVVGARIH